MNSNFKYFVVFISSLLFSQFCECQKTGETVKDDKEIETVTEIETVAQSIGKQRINEIDSTSTTGLTVNFYNDGTCGVRDKRSIKVVKGYNRLYVYKIPSSINNDSIIIKTSDDSIDIIDYENKVFRKNMLQILKAFVGSDVDCQIGEKTITGTLINVDNDNALNKNIAVIQTKDGWNISDLGSCHSILLKKQNEQTANLCVNLIAESDKEFDAEINYSCEDISFDLMYLVEMNSTYDKVNVTVISNVKNDTNIDFNNITAIFESLIDTTTNSYISCKIDGLPSNTRKMFFLKKFFGREMQTSRFIKIPKNFRKCNEKVYARKMLSVDYPVKLKKEDVSIEKSKSLFVYADMKRVLSVGNQAIFKPNTMTFDVGSVDDVFASITRVAEKKQADGSVEVSFIIRVENESDQLTDIIMQHEFDGRHSIIRSNSDHDEQNGVWRLTVEPKSKKDLYYKVKMWM